MATKLEIRKLNNMVKIISLIKIRATLSLFVVLAVCCELCMATIKIQGIIKDSETKEVLVYASLGLKKYPIGTCSNMNGEFQLVVDDSISNETLTVSAIGYESKNFKINEMDTSYCEILLDPKTIQLDEILVLPQITAEELLKKVIKNHSRNYPFGFCYYETFFRDIIRNDAPEAQAKKSRLTEAAINIEDFGLDSYRDSKFKVHEIRNSFNYVESDRRMKNFLFTGIQNPVSWMYKYNNIISQHYLKKLLKDKCYSKEIIGYTVFDGTPLYILELREKYFKFLGMTMNAIKGYNRNILYINTKNWAIQEAKHLLIGEDSLSHLLKAELKMQEFKGQYYLKLLDYDGYMPDELSKLDKSHQYKHKASILVNDIVLERKSIERIRRRNSMKTDVPLWNAEYKYNPEFWKTYNIILDKPIDPSVKKDLEQEVPLDNQFNDGGMKNSKKIVN